MKKGFVRFCAALLLGLPLFLVVSCGGGGGGDSITSSADSGTISVSVTDADVIYDDVVLRVSQLGAALADDEAVYYNASVIDWLPVSVDILDYPNEETFHLADIVVPDLPEDGTPVCFSQIRFVLEENADDCSGDDCSNYVTVEGSSYPLITPSAAQSGVKVLAPSDFCVSTGQTVVEVVLDIDPQTAILDKDNKNPPEFILKPTQIRIIEGEWSVQDPAASFVQGTVAVPVSYNTAGVCDPIDGDIVFPTVTVGAFELGASSDPVAQTLSMAEGSYDESSEEFISPYTASQLCTDRCAVAADPVACEAACLAQLDSADCFFAGNFKLLFPDAGEYDLGANWNGLSATVPYNATVYNSAVFMQLD